MKIFTGFLSYNREGVTEFITKQCEAETREEATDFLAGDRDELGNSVYDVISVTETTEWRPECLAGYIVRLAEWFTISSLYNPKTNQMLEVEPDRFNGFDVTIYAKGIRANPVETNHFYTSGALYSYLISKIYEGYEFD